MIRLILPIALICLVFPGFSQQAGNLLPDQNPNYTLSRQKYMSQKDSLLRWENTTIQETYKAYDWREVREERRNERRTYRRQLALSDRYYYTPFNYGWNNYYGYDSYYRNNYGWSNWRIQRPFIGFRTGNWWFGF